MSLLVFRKLLNNKWLFTCLLIGFLIAATVVCTIPVFSSGMMQRVFRYDMYEHQVSYGQYPGFYQVTANYNATAYGPYKYFSDLDAEIENELTAQINVPRVADSTVVTMSNRAFVPTDDIGYARRCDMVAMKSLPEKTVVVSGRMYQPGLVDGAYEVVLPESAMKTFLLEIGKEYYVGFPYTGIFETDPASGGYFKVRVVGVVRIAQTNDPYWFMDLSTYSTSMFGDYDTLVENFSDSQHLTDVVWFKAYDYTKMDVKNIRSIINTLEMQKAKYSTMGASIRFSMPTIDLMKEYVENEGSLKTTLWVLIAPLLVLLCFYIFMVSNLKLKNEANEIAVLKSRGASRMQIFGGYIMEWGVLAGVSMLFGPWLGYLCCYFLGASNGFLEFVSRTALPIKMSLECYLYGLAAMLIFAFAMLLPAFFASRVTIVEHKQRSARSAGKALWEKLYLDIVLLGVSVYGYFTYTNQLESYTSQENSLADMGVDPVTFLLTSVFLLGAGLLFLRLYPYIVRLIFWAGKRFWTPALYSSFIRVGRSGSKEIFVMLFIIYSVAVGIFSANSARTLNNNLVDRSIYEAGADVVATLDGTLVESVDLQKLIDSESFEEGAEVIRLGKTQNNMLIRIKSKNYYNFSVMAIEPHSFGSVTTMRSDLLDYHYYDYLNAINGVPNAVLLSSDYKQYLDVGDYFELQDAKTGKRVNCVVYAFVEYWPGFEAYSIDDSGNRVQNSLVVMNLDLMRIHFPSVNQNTVRQLWLTRQEGSDVNNVEKDIKSAITLTSAGLNMEYDPLDTSNANKGPVTRVDLNSQNIVKIKTDPTIQGLNGMLSLVFIITMVITTIGFLIYWILSLGSRTLQFGIYRAIGMGQKSVLAMIGVEQILISLCAIGVGLLLGNVSSLMFIRLFEMVYSASEMSVPFKVYWQMSDYVKIYLAVGAMLVIAFIVLTRIIRSIKIDQALKLGED